MSSAIAHYLDMMTQNNNNFFKQLGSKIASLRKEQQITQVQLAEILGISQQYMQAFEAGRRKVPSSMLPTLAEVLAVSVEELIGIASTNGKKRGPASKLLQQVEQISQLPKSKQKFVMDMLDTVIQQAAP
jgi:transcriptional regulator with XRE-family HTH domain